MAVPSAGWDAAALVEALRDFANRARKLIDDASKRHPSRLAGPRHRCGRRRCRIEGRLRLCLSLEKLARLAKRSGKASVQQRCCSNKGRHRAN